MDTGFQEITHFMVELSNKTPLPLELWLIIYELKSCIEYKMWEEKMRYLFSDENNSAGISAERIILRSGRNIARLNNQGSDLYNQIAQCIHSQHYEYSAYYKIYGLFQVVKNGELSGAVTLDIIDSKERSEVYNFKGPIDKKIWGESPFKGFFKMYLKLVKQKLFAKRP